MGQAKHRKKLLSLRGPRTRGTGIRYFDTPPEPKPTQEQLAAKLVRQQEQDLLDQHRQHRREIVTAICGGAERMLQKWRQQVESNAVRLRDFAGWTTNSMCSLPVDSDAARVYCAQFARHRERESKLTVEMMDEIVERIFHDDSSDAVVANILDTVRSTAEQSVNGSQFDKQLFLDILLKRQKREKANHDWVYYGLGFIHEMMDRGSELQRTERFLGHDSSASNRRIRATTMPEHAGFAFCTTLLTIYSLILVFVLERISL